jgi:hypothetical protein
MLSATVFNSYLFNIHITPSWFLLVGAKVGTYVISTHKDERFTNIFFCTLTRSKQVGVSIGFAIRRHSVSFTVVCVSIGFATSPMVYLSPVLTMSSLFSILSTAFPDENN